MGIPYFSRILSPAGLVIVLKTEGIVSLPKGGVYSKRVVGLPRRHAAVAPLCGKGAFAGRSGGRIWRRWIHLSDQTPSRFPAGSTYSNRRPPGNETISFTIFPPALITRSLAASKSLVNKTTNVPAGR